MLGKRLQQNEESPLQPRDKAQVQTPEDTKIPVQASKEKRNKLQRDRMTRSEHPPRKLTIIRKE